MDQSVTDQQLTGLSGLGDPLRRALYRHVAERGIPVSRDDAALAVGISRPLAAYHLDKLVDDGLLEARYQRRGGRQGPGAGRPAKHYVRADRQGGVVAADGDAALGHVAVEGAADGVGQAGQAGELLVEVGVVHVPILKQMILDNHPSCLL